MLFASKRRAYRVALHACTVVIAWVVCAPFAPAQPPAPLSRATVSRTALTRGVSAIVGATVIPMTGRADVLRDATVIVQDGRIVRVGARISTPVPRGAQRIDGQGKFLMPGLADMHAHLYADEWVPDSVGQHELGVFLAHGVTTARMMIGTPLQLTLRQQIEAGALLGPQLWLASPQLAGRGEPRGRVVRTPDEARAVVQSVADSGFDFVKLTVDITPDVYDAVVAEALAQRIPVVGHVDARVGVRKALAAKQQIEHLDNYMESVLADTAPSRVSVSDVNAYRVANWNSLNFVDDRKVDALAGATARAGIAVTPTLAFFRLWFATRTSAEEIRARPDYAHIPPKMRELYERSHVRYWQNPPADSLRARYIAVRNRLIRAIVDSGGHIMAGSDAPGGLMGYGWTLHRELETLVAAGLSPYDALATATTEPARFLGASNSWGSIRVGQRADLVLLDADPLANIRNTTKINRVAIGGRWIDQAMGAKLIEAARIRLNP